MIWCIGGFLAFQMMATVQGPEISDLKAESTIFFKMERGKLKQVVRATLNNIGSEGEATAHLIPTGVSKSLHLLPGDNIFYLLAPPFRRPERVKLTVRTSSREYSIDFEGRPERRWKVFVAPSAHTDIGYTDWQERVFIRHNENTETAIRACDEKPLFKWNMEVAFQAFLFRQHDPERFEKLMELVRKGRIGLQGLYLNMLTGICSGEELIQALARAQELGRDHGIRIESAILTDVPTSVGTLPMFLSKSGIRYFAEAVNQYRAPVFRYTPSQMRQSPFWWEGLDGSRVLTIFSDGYAQASGLGLTHSLQEAEERMPQWLRGFDREDYPYDAVLVYGAFGDNERLDPRYAEIVEEWNRKWEYPKILLSRVDEFFRYIETKFSGRIPTFRGDMGTYWEDGAASSSHETAMARWAKARLEALQRRHAIAALYGKGHRFPVEAVRSAWDDLLFYDEHTWGASCSVSDPESEQTRHQWAFKASFAGKAVEKVEKLKKLADEGLKGMISREVSRTSPYSIVVWNDLSWKRDILASVPLPDGETRWRIRDASTNTIVPSQSWKDRIVFLAEDVPPMGYRSYILEVGDPMPEPSLLGQGESIWEWHTPEVSIRFDPRTGSIISLTDRLSGREWVDEESGYGLNQFIYVEGGEGTKLIHPHYPDPNIQIHTHAQARISLLENGPVLALLHLERTGERIPAADTWILIQRKGRIKFTNILHKEERREKEAGYFAFPFKMERLEKVKAFVELPYGVLEVEREQIPGGCREWYSSHSFAAVSDGTTTACLATPHSPLLTFGDIFRGKWRGKLEGINGRIFAYVFNNYWDTNYKASQGGDMVFSFSLDLRQGSFDPVSATRFGWEELEAMTDPRRPNPLEVEEGWFIDPEKPSLSFLNLDSEALLGGCLLDGEKLMVRLYNPKATDAPARISFPGRDIGRACLVDLMGRRIKGLRVRKSVVEVAVPARGVITLMIEGGREDEGRHEERFY